MHACDYACAMFAPWLKTLRKALAWLLLPGLLLALPMAAWGQACNASGGATGTWLLPSGLRGTMMVLPDPGGTLNAEQLATLPDSAFAPAATTTVTGPGGMRPVWLRLCVARTAGAAQDWILSLRGTPVDRMRLLHGTHAAQTVSDSGAWQPLASRDVPARRVAFALTLPSGQPQALHLRLQGHNAWAVKPELVAPRVFLQAQTRGAGVYGAYLGMILMAAIVNTLFWWRLRATEHGFYAMALAGILGFSVLYSGYGAYVLPAAPTLLRQATTVFYAAGQVAFGLFAIVALRMHLYYPLTRRALLALMGLAGLLGVLAAGNAPLPLQLALNGTLLAGMQPLMVVCLHALRHHRGVRLYALALLPLQLALLLVLAGIAGVPGGRWALEHDWPTYGVLVHLVSLNLVLAQRAWRAQQGRARAQAVALRASRRSAAELQAMVAGRTEQLQLEVAQRRSAQERLAQALQTQRRFMSMVTHEFRTPLLTISMAAESLGQDSAAQHDVAQRSLARVRRAVGRMSALMENCVAEARVSEQAMSPPEQVHDLRDTLQTVVADSTAPERVRLDLPAAVVPVRHNAKLLGLAVSNLIGNALQYAPPDSPVDVSLRISGAQAHITVCDQGPGVAPHDRAHVFEQFFRGDAARSLPGVGQGLYLSRAMVEQHGGRLQLLPGRSSAGACFQISLPVAATVAA